jgi:hypothetical protein
MNVAFAERPRSSTDLKWKTMILKDYPENELLAFELPECPRDSVLVPTRLLVPTGSKDTELDTFFLVEIPNTNIDDSVVEAACVQRLESFFAPPLGKIEGKELIKIKSRLRDTKKRFEAGEKMHCHVIRKPAQQNNVFQRDDVVLRIATQRIDVLLNPDVIATNFRWDLLRNRNVDVQMSPKGKRITKTTLADTLVNFAREEVLDSANKAFCPHCRDFVRATKKMDIWTVPELLVIQLKRFFSKGTYQRKLDLMVEYPDEFEISPFVLRQIGETKYRLVGVIEHSGGLGGGHYIADVFHYQLGKWFRFNDEGVRAIKQSEVHSEQGYVLFYEKCQQ